MKLIPDIANFPSFWSVRLGSLTAILSAIELALPYFQTVVPASYFGIASFVTAVLTVAARAVAQPSLPPVDPK